MKYYVIEDAVRQTPNPIQESKREEDFKFVAALLNTSIKYACTLLYIMECETC